MMSLDNINLGSKRLHPEVVIKKRTKVRKCELK